MFCSDQVPGSQEELPWCASVFSGQTVDSHSYPVPAVSHSGVVLIIVLVLALTEQFPCKSTDVYLWLKFSRSSDRITNPDPPIKTARVILPPGTSLGSLKDEVLVELEYRSDHDIAAGRIPNSTSTILNMETGQRIYKDSSHERLF